MALFSKPKTTEIVSAIPKSNVPRNRLLTKIDEAGKGKRLIDTTFSIGETENEKVVPHKDKHWDVYWLIYTKAPVASNAVDHRVNFAIQSGFELEGKKTDVKKVQEWIDKNNFQITMEQILRQKIIYGDAYAELIDEGDDLKVELLPPETMFVMTDKLGKEIKGFRQAIAGLKTAKGGISFTPEEMVHFTRKETGVGWYGISEFESIIDSLTRLLNYEENIGKILELYAVPLRHHKLGTDDSPASADSVSSYVSNLNNKDPGDDLVTSSAVDIKDLTPALKMVQPDGLIKLLQDELISGLKVPEFFIRGGQTANKAIAKVEMRAFVMNVKADQRDLASEIEKGIFSKITDGEVKISWNEILVDDEETKSVVLNGLVSSGVPLKTALKMTGWGSWIDDVDEEMEDDMERRKKMSPAPFGDKKPDDVEEPKEDEFETQDEWVKAMRKYRKSLKKV